MSLKAKVSKVCPTGLVYIVPGALGMKEGNFFLPKTDEIFVDIMPTGAESVLFRKPTARLTLLGPPGCVFEKPNSNIPNGYTYSLSNDKTQIQAVFGDPQDPEKPFPLNRTNSLSYFFPITGRAARDVTVRIVVTGEPVQVVADSCQWTVEGLARDTTNLGNRPLDAIVSPVGV